MTTATYADLLTTLASAKQERTTAYKSQLALVSSLQAQATALHLQAQKLEAEAHVLLEPTEQELNLLRSKRPLELDECRRARATYKLPLYRVEFQGWHRNKRTYQCWLDDWDLSDSPMLWIRPSACAFQPTHVKPGKGYYAHFALVEPPSNSSFNTCLRTFVDLDQALVYLRTHT